MHSRCSALQADALLSWLRHPKSGAEYGNCTRASGLAIRGTAPIRTPRWSEQRESNSRHRVGGPRHQPLYHARPSKTLAGVTGFEPAKTGFGDQRPSRRVLTPVAVATGVEPVPPDRQSGILPLDPATFVNGCEGTIRTCMSRVRAGHPKPIE